MRKCPATGCDYYKTYLTRDFCCKGCLANAGQHDGKCLHIEKPDMVVLIPKSRPDCRFGVFWRQKSADKNLVYYVTTKEEGHMPAHFLQLTDDPKRRPERKPGDKDLYFRGWKGDRPDVLWEELEDPDKASHVFIRALEVGKYLDTEPQDPKERPDPKSPIKMTYSDTPKESFLIRTITEYEQEVLRIKQVHQLNAMVYLGPEHYLTPEHKEQFVRDGYCILRGVIPELVANAAIRAINTKLFEPGTVTVHPNGKPNVNLGLFQSQVMMDLMYESPLWGIINHILGRAIRVRRCQIAFRPPELNRADKDLPEDIGNHRWHVDGFSRAGNHSPFSILVGIALSEQMVKNHGNLSVWPGSHYKVLPYIKDSAEKGEAFLGGKRPYMGKGKQVMLQVGDVVIAHHKLCHQVSFNVSPNIRKQIYFRVVAADHMKYCDSGEILENLWCELPGFQEQAAGYTPPAATGEAESEGDGEAAESLNSEEIEREKVEYEEDIILNSQQEGV